MKNIIFFFLSGTHFTLDHVGFINSKCTLYTGFMTTKQLLVYNYFTWGTLGVTLVVVLVLLQMCAALVTILASSCTVFLAFIILMICIPFGVAFPGYKLMNYNTPPGKKGWKYF